MMYQLPIDMMMRMISVPLDTKSPCFQRASRPYGFSMVSLAGSPAPAGGVGALAGAGAAEAGWSAAGGVAWAKALTGATSGASATSAATSIADRRLANFIVIS